MRRPIAVVALALLIAPAPAMAQAPDVVRAEDLPVSLARIKRGLREEKARDGRHAIRLTYYVNVLADNPPINIFQDFDSKSGTVPFSAPTHNELFMQVTPQEFRSPPADLLGAAVWLGAKLAKKTLDARGK
jgi:hypothetical protein